MLNVLINLLSSLWENPTGQIFVLTAAAYFISYLIYAGYLSWFIPGAGSITISLADFNLIDVLTLLPVVVVTFFEIILENMKEFWIRTGIAMVVAILVSLLAVFSKSWLEYNIQGGTPVFLLGTWAWLLGMALGFFIFEPEKRKIRWGLGVIVFALVFFGTIFLMSVPITDLDTLATEANAFNEELSLVVWDILAILLIFFFPLFLFFVGQKSAEYSAQSGLLSRVSRVVLKQPVSGLGISVKQELNTSTIPVRRKGTRLNRPSRPPEKEYEVYVCTPQGSLCFLSALKNNTAFHVLPDESGNEKGKTILVSNDLIYQIEFANEERTSHA